MASQVHYQVLFQVWYLQVNPVVFQVVFQQSHHQVSQVENQVLCQVQYLQESHQLFLHYHLVGYLV